MKRTIKLPAFANEDEEATWWASRPGREFLKQKSAEPQKKVVKGSRASRAMNRAASVQIALRLPGPDVEKARELATRKGIGYPDPAENARPSKVCVARRGGPETLASSFTSSDSPEIVVRGARTKSSRPRASAPKSSRRSADSPAPLSAPTTRSCSSMPVASSSAPSMTMLPTFGRPARRPFR